MLINVEHLSKSFDYYRKELGLRNSIKNLFYREKLTKPAVQDISFQIEEGEMVGFSWARTARAKRPRLKCWPAFCSPASGQATCSAYALGAEEKLQNALCHRHGPEKPVLVGSARG